MSILFVVWAFLSLYQMKHLWHMMKLKGVKLELETYALMVGMKKKKKKQKKKKEYFLFQLKK